MIWAREEPNSDESLAEINRKLVAESRKLNLTPDPEMGGLSPDQVSMLIYTPWQSEQFPIHMNDNLPLKSCEQSKLFRNCRKMLIAIHKANGVKITSGGNFTRAFVAQMIDSLEINQENLAFTREYKKTINEDDVWDIHLTRVICQSAKLIRSYKGKFRILKKTEKLLDECCAGKLYKQLFIGLFTKFNLAYMDGRSPCYAIQKTLPYTLYRLSKLKQDKWKTIEELPHKILLPAVLAEVEYECSGKLSQSTSEMLAYRALKPLAESGLLEGTYVEQPLGFDKLKSVKLSPLWGEFLSFPDLP
ncbi:hypothetical protein ACFLS1_07285 [Verrucomicrobiota bacterium]